MTLKEKDELISQLRGEHCEGQSHFKQECGTPRMVHAMSLPEGQAERLFRDV